MTEIIMVKLDTLNIGWGEANTVYPVIFAVTLFSCFCNFLNSLIFIFSDLRLSVCYYIWQQNKEC